MYGVCAFSTNDHIILLLHQYNVIGLTVDCYKRVMLRIMHCISYCRICPIFQVSNVTGHNLDLLKSFLNLLTTRMPVTDDQPAEFQIDETYSVPVSTVVL